jgi:predicted transcriptional regulator
MAYDEGGEAIVMYGGGGDKRFLNDTWIYQTNASPPAIVTTLPTNGTRNVNVNSTIAITFNKAMNELATEGAVSSSPSIQWNATWTSQRRTITLVPSSDLQSGATYTITISKGAKGENGMALKQEYAFAFTTVLVPVSPGIGEEEVIAIVVVIAIAATVTAFIGVEWLLYALAALLLPLYMKIKKSEVLDHFLRGRIYEYVRQYPGAHFRMIMTELKVSIGTLRYHLDVLEKSGLITSKRNGLLKRFFSTEKEEKPKKSMQPLQKLILSILNKQPGLSADVISQNLNESAQVVKYHLRELCDQQIVMPRRTNKGVKYFSMRMERWPAEVISSTAQT